MVEASQVIKQINFQCNLCEGYQFLLIQQKGKEDKVEKCLKCHGTGMAFSLT
jgi:hypothetical protein